MKVKDKLIIAGITAGVVIGVLLAIKYLPFYTTLIAAGTFVAGTAIGVYGKTIYDKHFNKQG
jgi:F0F1-type ATP synthase assembly protein I